MKPDLTNFPQLKTPAQHRCLPNAGLSDCGVASQGLAIWGMDCIIRIRYIFGVFLSGSMLTPTLTALQLFGQLRCKMFVLCVRIH